MIKLSYYTDGSKRQLASPCELKLILCKRFGICESSYFITNTMKKLIYDP